MKPSGGGGEYAELIFNIWATRVGSPGIQFPMTIRPPGPRDPHHLLRHVKGPGSEHCAEDADDPVEGSVGEFIQVRGVAHLELAIGKACLEGAFVACLHQIARNIDTEYIGAEHRFRQRGGAVSASQVQDLCTFGDPKPLHEARAAISSSLPQGA